LDHPKLTKKVFVKEIATYVLVSLPYSDCNTLNLYLALLWTQSTTETKWLDQNDVLIVFVLNALAGKSMKKLIWKKILSMQDPHT